MKGRQRCCSSFGSAVVPLHEQSSLFSITYVILSNTFVIIFDSIPKVHIYSLSIQFFLSLFDPNIPRCHTVDYLSALFNLTTLSGKCSHYLFAQVNRLIRQFPMSLLCIILTSLSCRCSAQFELVQNTRRKSDGQSPPLSLPYTLQTAVRHLVGQYERCF